MTNYIAGVGCATAATPDEIVALVRRCCSEAGIATDNLVALASHARKSSSVALRLAALRLDLPLRFLDADELPTNGVSQAVAEVAGTILVPKRKSAYATCAIAACRPGFELGCFGQPASASAVMASSIEVTSWAGP